MAFSTYLQHEILNWLKGASFANAPAGVYVALFNNDTEVTTNVHPAGRVIITLSAIGADGSNSLINNSSAVNFGMSANSQTVTHFGLYDAASGGNQLIYAALGSSRDLFTGDAAIFNIGDLTITVG